MIQKCWIIWGKRGANMRKKQRLLMLLTIGFVALLFIVMSEKNVITAYADSIKDPAEFEGDIPLSPGGTVTVHVDKGETKYIRFASEESGYFLFSSASDKDTYGEAFGVPKTDYKGNAVEKMEYEDIYNDEMWVGYSFTFDDDSGKDGQFAIRYDYHYQNNDDYLLIAVSFYDYENESGDISVSCKEIPEPDDDDSYNIENHEYSFANDYVGIKDLKTSDFFSIDDENVTYSVHYYDGGYYSIGSIHRYKKEIPTETDDYSVCIKGTGDYYGTIEECVLFVGGDFGRLSPYSGAWLINDGKTPDPSLFTAYLDYYHGDDNYFLIYGSDFKVAGYAEYNDTDSWKNRKNLDYQEGIPSDVGSWIIRYEGLGNFYGYNYSNLKIIDKKSIELCYFEGEAQENETDYKSAKLVNRGMYCSGERRNEELIYGEDYYISKYRVGAELETPAGEWIDGAPTKKGTYDVVIVGMGNYIGEKEVRLKILAPYYTVTINYNVPDVFPDDYFDDKIIKIDVNTKIKDRYDLAEIDYEIYDEADNNYNIGGWKIEGMGDTIYSTKAINETLLTKNIKIIAQWNVDYDTDEPADLGNNNPDINKPTPTPAVPTPTPTATTPATAPTDGKVTAPTTAPTDGDVTTPTTTPTTTPSVTPSAVPSPATVKDKTTTFNIKNKAKIKKTAKIKIKDKDKIKKITLNGKTIKIKKNKTSITIKLKSYKKKLKKKGKWNTLKVTDNKGNTKTIKFKTK